MDNKYGSRIVGGNSAYHRIKSDFYPTPPEPTIALLDFLCLPEETRIWEPASGSRHMVNTILEYGYDVIGTDIESGQDYLTVETPDGVDWIITNPPFSQAEKFIKKSIERKLPFAFLLKQHFWNAKKRYNLFFHDQPTYILPLTWRPDFLSKSRGSGSPLMDMMWCIWNYGDFEQSHGITNFHPLLRPK